MIYSIEQIEELYKNLNVKIDSEEKNNEKKQSYKKNKTLNVQVISY
ncbi:hypothetical protein [Streptococcus uberis]|nr:hypothetical protein [Streptococcus uberis]